MTVLLTLRDKEYEVPAGMTIRQALVKLDIRPESVLAIRQGELITDDEILQEGEHIRLVPVISGGSS